MSIVNRNINVLPHTRSLMLLFSMPSTATEIISRPVTSFFINVLVEAVKSDGLANIPKRDALSILPGPSIPVFLALPAGNYDVLLKPEDKNQLLGLSAYHIGPGKVNNVHDAGNSLEILTMQATNMSADAALGETVDNATVTEVNDINNFGLIYLTDEAMLPERLTSHAPQFQEPASPVPVFF